MRCLKSFGLAVYFCAPGMLMAQTPITYTQDARAIFSVSMPDFWVARSGGPRVFEDPRLGQHQVRRILSLQPETNDSVWIGLASPEGITTLDEAQAYGANLNQFLVRDPVVRSRFETRLGGLPARIVNGEGTRRRERLRYSIVLVDLPGGRIAILVALAALDAEPGLIEETRTVLRSIKAGR